MKERPILFSAPMVRAILGGRKTQTRRIVRELAHDPGCASLLSVRNGGATFGHSIPDDPCPIQIACPYGAPGDRLWVRETWCPVNDEAGGGRKWIDYRATPKYAASHPAGWDSDPDDPDALRWRPAIHMPRWASRITLEVAGVRVERLQSITEEDAIAEGAPVGEPLETKLVRNGKSEPAVATFFHARDAFAHLWQAINAKRAPRASNPLVWVVEFRQVGQTAALALDSGSAEGVG